MYTFEPPICIPKLLLRRTPLRSTPRSISLPADASKCILVPLGLFLVAFPPPPVTSPVNEACDPKVSSDSAPRGSITSRRASSVFIRMTQASMPTDRAKAFRLRPRAYQAAAFRSFCPRTVTSPCPFHLSVPVKIPLAISTV